MAILKNNSFSYSIMLYSVSINAGYSHFYCIIVIWCIEFDFPDVRLSTKKPNMGGVILQIPCPMSHESVSKSYVQLSTNFRDRLV